MRLLRTLPALLLLLALLTACGGSSEDPPSSSGTTTDDPPPTSGTTADDPPSSSGTTEDPPSTSGTSAEDAPDEGAAGAEELFPDVIDATASQADDGSWTVNATLSSPYDSPERYADAWRVVGPDGEVYGERFLTHDHADEQPFTRSESGITIPDGITVVTVEGRDQVSGWGGETFDLELDRS